MPFELPKLKYSYDALEPYIDAATMEIHYTKHHAAYTNNLNTALQGYPELEAMTIEELLNNIDSVPEQVRSTVVNNGGGYYNHNLFWEIMMPGGPEKPKTELMTSIERDFGSFDGFKQFFAKQALSRFGSGWAWLAYDSNRMLKVFSTANQDTTFSLGLRPILALDVWEHAYYLKYQNKRAEYIENWWNVVNWDKVQDLYIPN